MTESRLLTGEEFKEASERENWEYEGVWQDSICEAQDKKTLKAMADLIEARRIAPGAKQSFFSDQDLADLRQGKMLGVGVVENTDP